MAGGFEQFLYAIGEVVTFLLYRTLDLLLLLIDLVCLVILLLVRTILNCVIQTKNDTIFCCCAISLFQLLYCHQACCIPTLWFVPFEGFIIGEYFREDIRKNAGIRLCLILAECVTLPMGIVAAAVLPIQLTCVCVSEYTNLV